jgi:hypothetical protein
MYVPGTNFFDTRLTALAGNRSLPYRSAQMCMANFPCVAYRGSPFKLIFRSFPIEGAGNAIIGLLLRTLRPVVSKQANCTSLTPTVIGNLAALVDPQADLKWI